VPRLPPRGRPVAAGKRPEVCLQHAVSIIGRDDVDDADLLELAGRICGTVGDE